VTPKQRPRIGVIVLTVAALICASVLVLGAWAYPRLQQAGIRSESSVLDQVRAAVTQWQNEHPQQCPTFEQLVAGGWLDSGLLESAKCLTPYAIQCTTQEIFVTCPDSSRAR